jgi:hypothetical protein
MPLLLIGRNDPPVTGGVITGGGIAWGLTGLKDDGNEGST